MLRNINDIMIVMKVTGYCDACYCVEYGSDEKMHYLAGDRWNLYQSD